MKRWTTLAIALLALVASTTPSAQAATAAEIDAKVDNALGRLLNEVPEAKEVAESAVAVLVFPEIVKGGAIVGGQYGEGALRAGDETTGYYVNAGASIGFQFGGQTYAYFMFFMSEAGLSYLDDSAGWDVGGAPTFVWGGEGWSEGLSVRDIEQDIIVFFADQNGMMAGAGLQGTKITQYTPD